MKISVIRDDSNAAGGQTAVEYEIPDDQGSSISSALQYINRHIDGSVAYYLSCRRGLCVCCTVKVEGKTKTACVEPAWDGMVLEPVRRDIWIKDTVVDLSMARDATFQLFDDESPTIAGDT